jgi:hypothetical protein
VRILDGQRSLTYAAHALDRSAAYRLGHGSELAMQEDGIEPMRVLKVPQELARVRQVLRGLRLLHAL